RVRPPAQKGPPFPVFAHHGAERRQLARRRPRLDRRPLPHHPDQRVGVLVRVQASRPGGLLQRRGQGGGRRGRTPPPAVPEACQRLRQTPPPVGRLARLRVAVGLPTHER